MGLQTTDTDLTKRISRRQDLNKVEDFLLKRHNIFIRKFQVGIDLIFGLEGQSFYDFESSFNKVANYHPNKIIINHLQEYNYEGKKVNSEILDDNYLRKVSKTHRLTSSEIIDLNRFKKFYYSVQSLGQITAIINFCLMSKSKNVFKTYFDCAKARCPIKEFIEVELNDLDQKLYSRIMDDLAKIRTDKNFALVSWSEDFFIKKYLRNEKNFRSIQWPA